MVVGCGLRKGSVGSGKGAASLVAEAGVTAMILVCADSALFAAKLVKAVRDAKTRFSNTVGNTKTVRAVIERIPERAEDHQVP